MSYHPRIESSELSNLLTTRSRNSELWFVNNLELEQTILGYAAKYAERYGVHLYALAIEGNHIQGTAKFPNANRADYMRDFNSSVARAVDRLTPEYSGGRFWGRRYSNEFLPSPDDIEEYFFYTVLQPVLDGLVERISDYPGYNCFHDAVWGISRKFKVVRWGEYNAARRYNPTLSINLFIDEVKLTYQRLAGYESLSQKDYAVVMQKKLEERRCIIVNQRREDGLSFVGRDKLLKTSRGSLPRSTKKSDINSHRPRILSRCAETRSEYNAWYFNINYEYRDASKRYRGGELDVEFPDGTYRPYLSCQLPAG